MEQGTSYYLKFVQKYPDVKKLAAEKEDAVLKLWQGLGYYSRARNLHHAAKDIVKRFKGKFPSQYEDIRSLKGIGEYTAAAISSFAFNQKFAVVDGNVFRVLSRYLGIKTLVNSSKAKKEFYEAAMELMAENSPHDFNQAIMEFGALHCKPQNPKCENCPLNSSCFAYSNKKVSAFPVKEKKIKIRNRYFNYLIIERKNKIHLRRRTGNDIWKNMYDFPMIETSKRISTEKLFLHEDWKKYFSKDKIRILSESKMIKHQLSHQTIYAKFFKINTSTLPAIEGAKAISKNVIHKFAVPKLIENYLRGSD